MSKKKSANQTKKERFRQSKKWKDFRHFMHTLQHGIDPITKKKLYKMANLHHMNLDESHYDDISNPDNFVFCNSKTHDALHWAYNYYKDDPEFLERFKYYLDKMVELNA
jgi:hypothetical protein